MGVDSKQLIALPEQVARERRVVHARLRDVLKKLTGTHSFHNFSPGFTDAADPRSMRSVYRCRSWISSGFHEMQTGRAFAPLRIVGRDFLYQQIRSMVGAVVAVTCGAKPATFLEFAFGPQCGIDVPCAPGANLVLARCVFRDTD